MTLWGVSQYLPGGITDVYGKYLNATTFALMEQLGVTHVQLWQRDFNGGGSGDTAPERMTEDQIYDAVQLMKTYHLEPEICLAVGTTVGNRGVYALPLVQRLGSDCSFYEICTEPHLKTECACQNVAETYNIAWNEIVNGTGVAQGCRDINPNAMYGGPAVGKTSSSQTWMNHFLTDCNPDFISYHSYIYQALTGESTERSWILANTAPQTTSIVNTYKNMLTSHGMGGLPIFITEAYYTSGSTPDYSTDQDFLNSYITAFFDVCSSLGVHSVYMWVFMGYNNLFAMVTQPPAYSIKPYYNAIQNYFTQSEISFSGNASLQSTGRIDFSGGASLLSQQQIDFSGDATLEVESGAFCSWGTPTEEQWVMFHHMGDVNDDGTIDLTDASLMSAAMTAYNVYGTYDEVYDLNHDDKINIFDALLLSAHYGQSICNLMSTSFSGNATLQSSGQIDFSGNGDLQQTGVVSFDGNASLVSSEGVTIAPYFATLRNRLENVTMPHRSNLDESPTRLLDQGPELHLDVGLDKFERLKQQFKKARASDSFERLKQRLKKAR